LGKQIGQFRYRLALDPRLLARIVEESEDVSAKLDAIKKWAKYANRRLEQIKNAPQVLWVTLEDGEEGCFLLDNTIQTPYGAALKPICGNQNARDGLVCTRRRGSATFHPGKGLCLDCEKKREGAIYRSGAIYKPGNETMIELNRSNQMPARLVECLERSEKLEEQVTRDLLPDLKTVYGMVQFVMEGGLHEISSADRESGDWRLWESDIKLINTLLKTAVEAKKVMFVMEKQQRIDPTTIKAFVGQVMSVVFSHVDAGTARKIGGEILDQVIRPFRNEGHIGGSEEEYHDVGKGMTKAIASYAGVESDSVQFPKGETLSSEELQIRAEEGLRVMRRQRIDYENSTGSKMEDGALKELRKKERRRQRRTNR
jgi:hypothetical protein